MQNSQPTTVAAFSSASFINFSGTVLLRRLTARS